MKKIIFCFLALVTFTTTQAQKNKKKNNTDTALTNHYQKYYKMMLENNDLDGAIEGLSHLIVLAPSEAKKARFHPSPHPTSSNLRPSILLKCFFMKCTFLLDRLLKKSISSGEYSF